MGIVTKHLGRTLLVVAVLSAALVAAPQSAHSAVTGRAFTAFVDLASEGIAPTTLNDTGVLPATGGDLLSYEPVATIGDVVTILDATAHAQGDNCKGSSVSSMGAGVVLAGRDGEVHWDGISSKDHDECCHLVQGWTLANITNLTFAGMPIDVTGQIDQVVDVPNVGTLHINELKTNPAKPCDEDDFVVNALHLTLSRGEDVVIGSTHFNSDDNCCVTPTHQSSWGSIKLRYR